MQPERHGVQMTRRRPELVGVRVVPWDEPRGLFGLIYEFDDGETIGEAWGTREETLLAAIIRKQDIRASQRPAVR